MADKRLPELSQPEGEPAGKRPKIDSRENPFPKRLGDFGQQGARETSSKRRKISNDLRIGYLIRDIYLKIFDLCDLSTQAKIARSAKVFNAITADLPYWDKLCKKSGINGSGLNKKAAFFNALAEGNSKALLVFSGILLKVPDAKKNLPLARKCLECVSANPSLTPEMQQQLVLKKAFMATHFLTQEEIDNFFGEDDLLYKLYKISEEHNEGKLAIKAKYLNLLLETKYDMNAWDECEVLKSLCKDPKVKFKIRANVVCILAKQMLEGNIWLQKLGGVDDLLPLILSATESADVLPELKVFADKFLAERSSRAPNN